MTPVPNYADLRKAEFRPRVHPNGFIQLNLDDTGNKRLHVWPDDDRVQGQKTNHPIHDHIFNMHSRVLCGGLLQCTATATLDPIVIDGRFEFSHEVYIASYSTEHESVLLPTGVKVNLSEGVNRPVRPGREYTQAAGTFHETEIFDGLTGTIMTKTRAFNHVPRILIPAGVEPDNDFVRQEAADDDLLWEYVERVLTLAHG